MDLTHSRPRRRPAPLTRACAPPRLAYRSGSSRPVAASIDGAPERRRCAPRRFPLDFAGAEGPRRRSRQPVGRARSDGAGTPRHRARARAERQRRARGGGERAPAHGGARPARRRGVRARRAAARERGDAAHGDRGALARAARSRDRAQERRHQRRDPAPDRPLPVGSPARGAAERAGAPAAEDPGQAARLVALRGLRRRGRGPGAQHRGARRPARDHPRPRARDQGRPLVQPARQQGAGGRGRAGGAARRPGGRAPPRRRRVPRLPRRRPRADRDLRRRRAAPAAPRRPGARAHGALVRRDARVGGGAARERDPQGADPRLGARLHPDRRPRGPHHRVQRGGAPALRLQPLRGARARGRRHHRAAGAARRDAPDAARVRGDTARATTSAAAARRPRCAPTARCCRSRWSWCRPT